MSMDSDPVQKPVSQHREPPPQQPQVKKKQQQMPEDEIVPPSNPMSSFQSSLPNIRTMSDIIDSKDASANNVPLKTKEMYVSESQLVDPIVAQYANADPKQLEVEMEEPYSPTTEEREAPYDPSDPTDDWMVGRSMPISAVIPEPAIPSATKSFEEVGGREEVGGSLEVGKQPAESNVQPSDITAASDASEDLLSAFSSQDGLSEQQQLLIQLTKQVEEAKKALLDRQIESLQSEINKATNKLGKGDESQSDDAGTDAGTSPDVRLAPADSSTMTPKDDVPSTPGGAQSEATGQATDTPLSPPPVPELAPPPELPPFAVGAVLWNAAKQEEKPSVTPHVQHPGPHQQQAPVEGVGGPPGRMDPAHGGWREEPWRQLPQQVPQNQWSQEKPPRIDPPMVPDTYIPDPLLKALLPGHVGASLPVPHLHLPPLPLPPPHPHPPPHQHPTPPHIHHQVPMPHQDPRAHHPLPHFPPPQQPVPEPEPAPVTKKRKLEPPPPGVEGWKYGDDDEGHGDDGARKDTSRSPEPPAERRKLSAPGRDVDDRRRFEGNMDTDDRDKRRKLREGNERDDSWMADSDPWTQDRVGRDRRHERDSLGWDDSRRRDPRRAYEDFPPRDFDKRGQTVDYQHKKPIHGGDPRLRHEKAARYQRDFDYRSTQR